MNVRELRLALNGLPDDAEVECADCGYKIIGVMPGTKAWKAYLLTIRVSPPESKFQGGRTRRWA